MSKGFIKGGLIGVAIGAVSGLLFAPKSGKDTRQDIKAAAVKANKEAEKRLKQLHIDLKHKTEDAKNQASTLKGKAKLEMIDLGKKADIVKEKISETMSAVRDFEAEEQEIEKTIAESEEMLAKLDKKTKKK